MNVQKVWEMNITGKGIVVTILDDGLEKDHPDIIQNYVSPSLYKFLWKPNISTKKLKEGKLIKNGLAIIKKSSYWNAVLFVSLVEKHLPLGIGQTFCFSLSKIDFSTKTLLILV